MLYAASVLPLQCADLYRLAYERASPERQKKADGYRFEKDRRLSLGVEMLLRYGLREANVPYDRLRIKTNDAGKPVFTNADLHFNVSHAEDWAICAISDAEIGCDIEKIRSADLRIAQRFFCPEEYHHIIEQASAVEQDLLFYRYWTLKESFIKATGLGMQLPFNAFRIELGERIRVSQSVDQREYFFTEFGDISGYCCAVCCVEEPLKVPLKVIDLHPQHIVSSAEPIP